MANVDMELRRAFQELQLQVIDSREKIRQMDVQIELSKRSAQHSKLTQNEIKSLPDGVNVYESVGRMFVKRNIHQISQLLDGKIKTNEDKIKSLESSKSYLETSVKESENNLRELINQKKASDN